MKMNAYTEKWTCTTENECEQVRTNANEQEQTRDEWEPMHTRKNEPVAHTSENKHIWVKTSAYQWKQARTSENKRVPVKTSAYQWKQTCTNAQSKVNLSGFVEKAALLEQRLSGEWEGKMGDQP